jgi:hypothetical protein
MTALAEDPDNLQEERDVLPLNSSKVAITGEKNGRK